VGVVTMECSPRGKVTLLLLLKLSQVFLLTGRLGRPRRPWEGNIETDLVEIGYGT
jgi:hypothetical protein